MLQAAGFETPARTLDELTEQALKIKEARVQSPDGKVIQYPIVLGFRQLVAGFGDWWSLNYASEVSLFDDDINPIFPDDEERRAERILQWIVDGIHKHRTIDINSLTMGLIRENIAAGRQTFALVDKYDVECLTNSPQRLIASGRSGSERPSRQTLAFQEKSE